MAKVKAPLYPLSEAVKKLDLKVPKKLKPMFAKRHDFKILRGGRSSAKTATIIRYMVIRSMEKKTLILCTREYQSSIESSTYAELRDFIMEYNLLAYFTIKHDKIVCINGSQFIFKGLARDIMSIKGIPNIGICFVEEAETISALSWDILIPTIEKSDGSELIIAFNPRDRLSPTYQMFVENVKDLSGDVLSIEINYDENPFISKKQLATILKLRETNYAKYEHIYLGKVLDISEEVIFKGCFEIKELEVKPLTQVRYGQDYGFSQDPFAMVQVYLIDDNTIYIDREIYETGLLPVDIMNRIRAKMPDAMRRKISAESARPDTIAQLNAMGLRVEAAKKLKGSGNVGSIESGIQYLQGKKIIVHPRCTNVIYEFYNYKFKKDKEGTILPDPIDKFNHAMDALRYALWREISVQGRTIKFNDSVNKLLD